MTTTAVVVPVKDGGELLAEVLTAISRDRPDELLVIDSGSSDDSVRVARDAGATVIEIAPEDFSHGRTRNLAAQSVNAELVCFLTQDATPQTGWLQAYVDAFASSDRIGAAFGPHLPRADTSPMIARELTEFFAGFSPNGAVTLEPSGIDGSWHPGFLSNANSAYRRSILLEIEFRDVEYAEDQAFARDLLEAGYLKAYVPDAAALHAHDFPLAQFMKRYFDEYRGLSETVGHVEAPAPIATARRVRDQVAGDAEWMRSNGFSSSERARWLPRAAAHHGGRHLAAVLGSRAERLPAPVQSALSLENRNGTDKANRTEARSELLQLCPRPRGERTRRTSRAGLRDERGRAPPRRDRDPAVQSRKWRPRHDLSDLQDHRADGAQLLDLACRSDGPNGERMAGGRPAANP